MIRNVEFIRESKGMWPHLRHIWPFDETYQLLDEGVLEKLIPLILTTVIRFPDGREVSLGDLYNVSPQFDCEDFAIVAMAIERLYVKLAADEGKLSPHPVIFGLTAGTEFRGQPLRHAVNMVRLKEGLTFIDFSDDMVRGRKWKASGDNDSPFFMLC